MKDFSLHILDIAENAAKAGATLLTIRLKQQENRLLCTIADNGCGMSETTLQHVTDPFYTTRTTRPVGMGLPLLRQTVEQTGGMLSIRSRPQQRYPKTHGTVVEAVCRIDHIDMIPLGDVPATLLTLLQGHPAMDILFTHTVGRQTVRLDTRQMREVLGEDISLGEPEVLTWVASDLAQQYQLLRQSGQAVFL